MEEVFWTLFDISTFISIFVSFKELNYDDEEEEEDEEGDDSVFTSDEKQNQDSGKPDAVSEQGYLSPHISTELVIFGITKFRPTHRS